MEIYPFPDDAQVALSTMKRNSGPGWGDMYNMKKADHGPSLDNNVTNLLLWKGRTIPLPLTVCLRCLTSHRHYRTILPTDKLQSIIEAFKTYQRNLPVFCSSTWSIFDLLREVYPTTGKLQGAVLTLMEHTKAYRNESAQEVGLNMAPTYTNIFHRHSLNLNLLLFSFRQFSHHFAFLYFHLNV